MLMCLLMFCSSLMNFIIPSAILTNRYCHHNVGWPTQTGCCPDLMMIPPKWLILWDPIHIIFINCKYMYQHNPHIILSSIATWLTELNFAALTQTFLKWHVHIQTEHVVWSRQFERYYLLTAPWHYNWIAWVNADVLSQEASIEFDSEILIMTMAYSKVSWTFLILHDYSMENCSWFLGDGVLEPPIKMATDNITDSFQSSNKNSINYNTVSCSTIIVDKEELMMDGQLFSSNNYKHDDMLLCNIRMKMAWC